MAPRKNMSSNKWRSFALVDNQSVASSAFNHYSDFNSTAPTQKQSHLRTFQFYIPDEITCTSCQVPKGIRGFAEVQQEKYRSTRGKHQIVCMQCVCSRDPTEIKCDLCHKTMLLDKFARSKRGKHGRQECIKCVASLSNGHDDLDENKSMWSDSMAGADERSTKPDSRVGGSRMQKGMATVQRRWFVDEERHDRGEDWEIDDSDVEVESSDSESWSDADYPF